MYKYDDDDDDNTRKGSIKLYIYYVGQEKEIVL